MFSNQSRPLATFGSCAGFAILTFTAAGAQEPLFRQLPADVQLSARQAALVESAKTSGAAIGTKVMTVEFSSIAPACAWRQQSIENHLGTE